MVPTDNVGHSEPESEYDKEIAESRNDFNLNTQSKEPAHSGLENSNSESARSIGNQLADKVVHTSMESNCEEDIVANRSN